MGDPFYHVPTSSCREVLRPTCDLQSGRPALKRYEYDHNFSFQTSWTSVPDEELSPSQNSHSQRRATHETQRARSESLPTMAFADELFCDGKVLPLRPPPQFHCGNRSWDPSPDASPPTSPYPSSRLLLQHRKIWNDDFDPFAAALEKVREEDTGRTRVSDHRRSFSLSSFRAFKLKNMGKKSSDLDPDQRTPYKNVKTDHERSQVNAKTSKKQGLKSLLSFASLGFSSCLRTQIYHPLHPQGEKPTKRR